MIMINISQITLPIAILTVGACAVSPPDPSRDSGKASLAAPKTPAAKPVAQPAPIPSPWQPEAEVDPVPPPVEDATPLPR